MQVVHGLHKKVTSNRCQVAIGVFDGVHLGHQELLTTMVQAAKAGNSKAVGVTFDPHPAATLRSTPPLLLTTLEERIPLLESLGLDILVVVPFTHQIARTEAADFVVSLTSNLDVAGLWYSEGFAIGQGRTGDDTFLRRAGEQRGFATHVVEPARWQGAVVSSSRVRRALESGDLRGANGCLGRPYRLTGEVVHGDNRGRLFGVPTANLALPPQRLVPANGIYACRAHSEQVRNLPAVTSVGTRPSFDGHQRTVEAHVLDFQGDLYGRSLAVDFHKRLRDEMVFLTTEQLTAQIDEDISQARVALATGKEE
jgi:riboflavin kinase/FMN adenylyltransferase